MKKVITILAVALTAIAVLAFSNFEKQDNEPTYIIVHVLAPGRSIFIYYGSQTSIEEITLKKGEDINLKLVDVLNDLSKKGYELVTSTSNSYNGGQFTGFDHTLKKTK